MTSTETIEIYSTIYVTESLSTSTTAPFPTSTALTIDVLNIDYGYVPQELIDWMAADPDYSARYPGLESCLPAGKSNFTSCLH